jgi:hypothetical protein
VSARAAGLWWIAAAALFFASWLLMPGVGVTDAREILERVGRQPGAVRLSALLQLASAACYAPALLAVPGLAAAAGRRGFTAGAALLLVGAMGSAADAVFHLLAAEMVAPGVDRAAMLPVMERMQGPNLALLAPMIAAFFAGSIVLSVAFARAGLVARVQPLLHAAGLAAAVAGALAAPALPGAARAGGLALLGLVSASQAWLGVAMRRAGALCSARR